MCVYIILFTTLVQVCVSKEKQRLLHFLKSSVAFFSTYISKCQKCQCRTLKTVKCFGKHTRHEISLFIQQQQLCQISASLKQPVSGTKFNITRVSVSPLQDWQQDSGLVPLQKWQNSHWGANRKEVRPLLFSSPVLCTSLPQSYKRAFGPVHAWQIQQTDGQLVGPGEVSHVSAPGRHWAGIKSNLLTRTCVLNEQCLMMYHCPSFYTLLSTVGQ